MIGSFPEIPNLHALFSLLTMAFALFLFTRESLRLEISSFAVMVLLALGFSLFPYTVDDHHFEAVRFFYGFSHEALISVCALMVIGQGLVHTGALEPFGRLLTKAWRVAPFISALVTLVTSAILSAFVNNAPIVVLLLPILISVGIRTNKSPSKILMPMGFATIVGGMGTTIGTSTNLLVVSVANDIGLPRMEMFDFAIPAVIAGGIAILYLWLVAPLLLPDTKIDVADSSPRVFQALLALHEDSPTVGKSFGEAQALLSNGVKLSRLKRGERLMTPLPDTVLKDGDRLWVMNTAKALREAAEILKATLYSDDIKVDEDHPLAAENQTVAEIAVVAGSSLAGQNLRYTRFLEQHQLIVLALHRADKDIWKAHEEIMDVALEPGDILLVQGDFQQIHKMKLGTEFLVLDASEDVPKTGKAPIALLTLLLVVSAAAFGVAPIAVSSMVGVLVLIATRSLEFGAAIRAINASVVFVVVASLAIGLSLEITGASLYMTEVFLYFFQSASPTMIMSALMLMMGVLTNIVSNNAAAVIGTPIGAGIAQQLGVPPEAFVLAVLFGANLSFATPMAYKTNLLVMAAGNYKFSDFLKVGVPLTVIMWLSYTFILSSMYL